MNVEHRDSYGLAIRALKRFADEGRFGWGEPLVVKDLAAEIGLSPTPVREALACLSGEGLIERQRGRGYFFPALTASDIIDLYDLQWSYLHSALTLHARGAAALHKAAAALDPEAGFAPLFAAMVAHSANDALITAYDQLAKRLAPVWRAEADLIVAFQPTAAAIVRAVTAANCAELLQLVGAHHRQRCELAGETARILRRTASEEIEQI